MIPLCLSIKKVFDGSHFNIFESCFSYVQFNIFFVLHVLLFIVVVNWLFNCIFSSSVNC